MVLDKGNVLAFGPRDDVLEKTVMDPRKPRLATAAPGKVAM